MLMGLSMYQRLALLRSAELEGAAPHDQSLVSEVWLQKRGVPEIEAMGASCMIIKLHVARHFGGH